MYKIFLSSETSIKINKNQNKMHLPYLLLTLTSLTPCIALEPWYFTWTDPSNKTHSESASTPDNTCFKIDNPIGKYFDWTAGDGWCIYFWENSNCTGTADAGHTCNPWPWRAVAEHHHPRSFRAVVNGSDPSASASPSPSPSGSSAAGSSGDGAGSGGSLSGGAIAGIVIGVVAGVAILAVATWFFFFYRRRQKSNPTGLDSLAAGGDVDKKETGTHSPVITTLAELPHSPDQPSELMGDNSMRVEMSDTQRVAELDGTGIQR